MAILTHYCDIIMGTMASQITSLTIVCSTVYSGSDQRKHQSSASLVFLQGIHQWPVNYPHKWPVTRKCFHLMMSSCSICSQVKAWTKSLPIADTAASIVLALTHKWHGMSTGLLVLVSHLHSHWGITFHLQLNCFFKGCIRLTTEASSKLWITRPLWGESTSGLHRH